MAEQKKVINMTESQLILRAKQGDEESFEALILSCKGRAYNIAFRYMRNEEDAMDALQESFIKIFRHLDKFNEESQFDTWVYRIVVNACHDMLRKNKGKTVNEVISNYEEDENLIMEVPDRTPGPAESLERKEESSYIVQCLEKIGHDHKQILILRDMQGFSYEEISQILDCSMGTVKSRLARARQKLKDVYLAADEAEQNDEECV